ncbi:MAG: hypothetical protein Kow0074_21670 [Candidatus Zixiibacteriota bacterium]
MMRHVLILALIALAIVSGFSSVAAGQLYLRRNDSLQLEVSDQYVTARFRDTASAVDLTQFISRHSMITESSGRHIGR